VIVRDLGRLGYRECVELQRDVLELVAAGDQEDTLLFVEHDPVITLGSSFHEENLLVPMDEFAAQGIEIVRTERGGDVTYHGPGQIVAYPIFNLERHGKDVHKWLRDLEETVILALHWFGLEGYRFPPYTGVWVNDAKICAMGVKLRRWTSMHGLALNCNNDLSPFSLIVPCGIQDHPVTSVSRELGHAVELDEVRKRLEAGFVQTFEFPEVQH
jgi:lipoyl(octanoyl) transferase